MLKPLVCFYSLWSKTLKTITNTVNTSTLKARSKSSPEIFCTLAERTDLLMQSNVLKTEQGASELTQWVKGLATKPHGLSSILASTWWKERTNYHRLFSEPHTHKYTHFCLFVFLKLSKYQISSRLILVFCGTFAFKCIDSRYSVQWKGLVLKFCFLAEAAFEARTPDCFSSSREDLASVVRMGWNQGQLSRPPCVKTGPVPAHLKSDFSSLLISLEGSFLNIRSTLFK